jgi:hypothetical protein
MNAVRFLVRLPLTGIAGLFLAIWTVLVAVLTTALWLVLPALAWVTSVIRPNLPTSLRQWRHNNDPFVQGDISRAWHALGEWQMGGRVQSEVVNPAAVPVPPALPAPAAQPNAEPTTWKPLRLWGPGGYFSLDVLYVAMLVFLLISRQAHWLWIDRIHDPIGGIVPLGVPWFGALGGVTISIYGVVDHNDHWQSKWGLWHAIRPIVGAILGTLAFLIFISVIQATGSVPSAITPPKHSTYDVQAITYLVIAFVVGFREQTFRTLITKVIDLLLSPGDATKSPIISISPTPVDFGTVTVGQHRDANVTLTNSGIGPLIINGSVAVPRGLDVQGSGFSLQSGAIEGATINPSASVSLVLRFVPSAVGAADGTLVIESNAGKFPVPLTAIAN